MDETGTKGTEEIERIPRERIMGITENNNKKLLKLVQGVMKSREKLGVIPPAVAVPPTRPTSLSDEFIA